MNLESTGTAPSSDNVRFRWLTQGAVLSFSAAFCLTFLMYSLALAYSLSSDSYGLLFFPQLAVEQHSGTARPLAAAIQWIIDLCGINIIEWQSWTAVISMITLALAVAVLHRHLVNICRRADAYFQVFALLCSFIIVSTPFHAEWFTFSFITPAACMAELLAVIAAIRLSKPALSAADTVLVFLLAVASAALFQSPVSLLVPVAVLLLSAGNAPARTMLNRFILGAAAYVTAGIVCFLYLKIVHPMFSKLVDTRTTHLDLVGSLITVLKEQGTVWIRTFDLLPHFVFAGFIVLALSLLLSSRQNSQGSAAWLGAGLSVLAAIGMAFGPHIVTAGVWLVPRSLTTIPAIPGLLCLFALCAGRENLWWKWALAFVVVAWVLVTVSGGNRILADHLSSDRQDREEARLMVQSIQAYEQANHTQITKVAFVMDRFPMWCYPNVWCFGDLNVRTWVKPYARVGLLRVASGRVFQSVPFPGQSVQEIFGTDNWNFFSPDQIRFVGDTAYIAIY